MGVEWEGRGRGQGCRKLSKIVEFDVQTVGLLATHAECEVLVPQFACDLILVIGFN